MDRFVSKFPGFQDMDLNICLHHEVAYQRDMDNLIPYDQKYFENYVQRENTPISKDLNKGRVHFVEKFYRGELLDIGVGSGEFIRHRPKSYGYDVNPVAINWLSESGLYRDDFPSFYAFTMWDVLEHIKRPEDYFVQFPTGAFLFVSIPLVEELIKVRESKHYKPGEHLYYWTRIGLISWMARHGFGLYGQDDFETRAGRESIYSFAFRKL